MTTSNVSGGTAGLYSTGTGSVAQLVGGVLVELRVELGVAAQDRVEPLDRRDRHPRDRVDLVRAEVLDVVELGELAAVVGRREALELLQRLAAEVRAVDEEQDRAARRRA